MIHKTAVAAPLMLLLLPLAAFAQTAEQKITSAMSAAPVSIAEAATIVDWDRTELRAGTNGWICLPDVPDTPGVDPMCLDGPWQTWVHAWRTKTDPSFDRMGFGYMLAGDSPTSNVDPYATGPTADNEWIAEGGPHIMVVVPDTAWLEGIPTDPAQGGPWVMWRGTTYAHIMIPLPKP
ncbi:MAG: hypothetical protein ACE5HQ_08995 [Gemmatimonadota bacterium]